MDSFIDIDTEVTKQQAGEPSLQARAVDALEELQTCCEQLGLSVTEFLKRHESGEFKASETGDEKVSEVEEPADLGRSSKKAAVTAALKKKNGA